MTFFFFFSFLDLQLHNLNHPNCYGSLLQEQLTSKLEETVFITTAQENNNGSLSDKSGKQTFLSLSSLQLGVQMTRLL